MHHNLDIHPIPEGVLYIIHKRDGFFGTKLL